MQPEELKEGKFILINEQRGHEEKDDDDPEKVMLIKHFTLKEVSQRYFTLT